MMMVMMIKLMILLINMIIPVEVMMISLINIVINMIPVEVRQHSCKTMLLIRIDLYYII